MTSQPLYWAPPNWWDTHTHTLSPCMCISALLISQLNKLFLYVVSHLLLCYICNNKLFVHAKKKKKFPRIPTRPSTTEPVSLNEVRSYPNGAERCVSGPSSRGVFTWPSQSSACIAPGHTGNCSISASAWTLPRACWGLREPCACGHSAGPCWVAIFLSLEYNTNPKRRLWGFSGFITKPLEPGPSQS